MMTCGTPGEIAMPSRRIDQFVGLACFVLLLLTKGAAIAGAPAPNSDQPSTVPSSSAEATPAPAVVKPPLPPPNQDTPTAQHEVQDADGIDAPIIKQLHNLANGNFDRI